MASPADEKKLDWVESSSTTLALRVDTLSHQMSVVVVLRQGFAVVS